MARRSRNSLGIKVDGRTADMADYALTCRADGHSWQQRAPGRARIRELIADGCYEKFKACENCGSTWRITYSIRDGEIVEQKREYPKGTEYLMPKGAGRLSKSAARVAEFARLNPSYV